jgi:hypothetical protein
MDYYKESKRYDISMVSIYKEEYGIPGTSHNYPILASSPKQPLSIYEAYSVFPTIYLFVDPRSGSYKSRQFFKPVLNIDITASIQV